MQGGVKHTNDPTHALRQQHILPTSDKIGELVVVAAAFVLVFFRYFVVPTMKLIHLLKVHPCVVRQWIVDLCVEPVRAGGYTSLTRGEKLRPANCPK